MKLRIEKIKHGFITTYRPQCMPTHSPRFENCLEEGEIVEFSTLAEAQDYLQAIYTVLQPTEKTYIPFTPKGPDIDPT